MTWQSRARERAEKMSGEEAAKFAAIAKPVDDTVTAVLATFFANHPDQEDAIVSGAMTALVRFGIQRQQAERPLEPLQVRDAFGYFARWVQMAAELLLKP